MSKARSLYLKQPYVVIDTNGNLVVKPITQIILREDGKIHYECDHMVHRLLSHKPKAAVNLVRNDQTLQQSLNDETYGKLATDVNSVTEKLGKDCALYQAMSHLKIGSTLYIADQLQWKITAGKVTLIMVKAGVLKYGIGRKANVAPDGECFKTESRARTFLSKSLANSIPAIVHVDESKFPLIFLDD